MMAIGKFDFYQFSSWGLNPIKHSKIWFSFSNQSLKDDEYWALIYQKNYSLSIKLNECVLFEYWIRIRRWKSKFPFFPFRILNIDLKWEFATLLEKPRDYHSLTYFKGKRSNIFVKILTENYLLLLLQDNLNLAISISQLFF